MLMLTMVAPLAGAWIETLISRLQTAINVSSRPSRARGLKLRGGGRDGAQLGRAPRGRVD